MIKNTQKRNYKPKEQIRDEKYRSPKGGKQVRGEREERINGAPVYTASYKVNRSDELLEFLLRKCNTSRNNVKSLLVRKQVLVNGSVVTQYDFVLAKDDEVKISQKPMKEVNIVKVAPKNRRTLPVKLPFKIIYEDEDFIAIDKPVGLLSVESDKDTECAYGYLQNYLAQKEKNARPFTLHRIDKETSGVLAFAKNVKIHSMLKLHWNEQVQLREYYAVVEGVPEPKSGTLVHYLKENVNNLVYCTKDPSGQRAVTKYEVVKENGEYSLLKVQIETGRKNQIRVQMKEIGHCIAGDSKYGTGDDPMGRLGLHASKVQFIHPVSKELITLNAPLPPSFGGVFATKQGKGKGSYVDYDEEYEEEEI